MVGVILGTVDLFILLLLVDRMGFLTCCDGSIRKISKPCSFNLRIVGQEVMPQYNSVGVMDPEAVLIQNNFVSWKHDVNNYMSIHSADTLVDVEV